MGIKAQIVSLLVLLVVCCSIFYWQLGPLDPMNNKAFFFSHGLLLLLLGFFLIERHFTKQRDIVVNCIAVLVSLSALSEATYTTPRLVLMSYAGAVLILTIISIMLLGGKARDKTGPAASLVKKISRTLGNARVMFSLVFFYGLAEFNRAVLIDTTYLPFVAVWALILVWEPWGIGAKVDDILGRIRTKSAPESLGMIVRAKSPDIVLCELHENVRVGRNDVVEIILKDASSANLYGLVLNLFFLDDKNWANIRILSDLPPRNAGSLFSKSGEVVAVSSAEDRPGLLELVSESHIYSNRDHVVGTVDVNTSINMLKIQVTNSDQDLSVGRVVYLNHNEKRIYYQINAGITDDEYLEESNRYGFVCAHASQLGAWDEAKLRFTRYDWVPPLNSVVFLYKQHATVADLKSRIGHDRYLVGHIPHTDFPVCVDVSRMVPHHYSILGITGCGKTTFEIDLIKEKVARGLKVLCFDITGDYAPLFELNGIEFKRFYDDEVFNKLKPIVIALEYEYSQFANNRKPNVIAVNEKALHDQLSKCVQSMFDDTCGLFLVEIEELANVTNVHDLFQRTLGEIFEHKKNMGSGPDISIVFEEAHTIIPERSSSTYDYRDADRIVAKIAQITLQGRKYGIGFTIITQRTANVTKTILNQCNTVFSFACFDRTGKEFLANYYGEEYANILPNLGQYQILAAGKALNSDLPLIVQLEKKSEAELPDMATVRVEYKKGIAAVEESNASDGRSLQPAEDDDLPF